ncbi:PIG-L deacetylase family protein [Streptomyces sp. NPDC002574]|uniref:PIG-L deacetylase family protein n=1 Tax=Streptomyces sp. NPDC002574 TaxID=3364652 RepID=UPI00369484AA
MGTPVVSHPIPGAQRPIDPYTLFAAPLEGPEELNTPDNRPTLMVVHAHPDDEASQTGGTLARYAAEGIRTVLVTCTDGGQGDDIHGREPGHRDHRAKEVAARRSRELAMSRTALGIDEVVQLGHPDSGMHGSVHDIDPRAFSRLEGEPIVRRLEALMNEYRPDVIVTYPPNGLSRHPDHIRTHELTVAAAGRVREAGGFPPRDSGTASHRRIPKLYYIALSHSRLKAVRARAEAAFGTGVWTPPLEIGVADDTVTTTVDVSGFWDQKLRALAAHAGQADAAALLRVLSVSGHENPVEEYIRVDPPWKGGEREGDLFEGIAGDR